MISGLTHYNRQISHTTSLRQKKPLLTCTKRKGDKIQGRLDAKREIQLLQRQYSVVKERRGHCPAGQNHIHSRWRGLFKGRGY